MIIKHFQRQTVADNGTLTDSNIGKRAGMHQTGLILIGATQGRVDCVAHPCGHRAVNLQHFGGNRPSLLIISQNNVADTFAQIRQISGHGQNRHQLGRNGNRKTAAHGKPVHFAANTNHNITQALCRKVDNPIKLHPVYVNIQTLQSALCQRSIVIIIFMLHSGVQRYHAQIMGIRNIINIASQPQRKLGHGNKQGIAAAPLMFMVGPPLG